MKEFVLKDAATVETLFVWSLVSDELRYILDPADVKDPNYPSETFRVLKEKEIRHHSGYRTRRIVLEARDRMEANGDFTAMGM